MTPEDLYREALDLIYNLEREMRREWAGKRIARLKLAYHHAQRRARRRKAAVREVLFLRRWQ